MRIAKFERHAWMQSVALVLFEKVSFYAGISGSIAISINLDLRERCLTLQMFNLYCGVEVWFGE